METHKLTKKQVRKMKKQYSKGKNFTQIAKRHDVHRTTVSRAVRGVTYPNVN